MARSIRHRYDDPLDLIWLSCARSIGWQVERSDEVYASFDGQHTLTLSTREHFDADDSLGQLIFHELCHALVAGPRGVTRADWGMENVDQRDLEQEHACHRVQAALADRHGLRALFAVTTEHRSYWDALPIDPLGPGEDAAIPLARDAFERALTGPWREAIERALQSTAELAAVMRTLELPADSLWRATRALHASGFPLGDLPEQTCGDCAWSYPATSAAGGQLRCRQSRAQRSEAPPRARKVEQTARACVRFEPRLSEAACGVCGACCREGFDRVELSKRELTRQASPRMLRLVVVDGFGPHIPRPGGSCAALESRERASKTEEPHAALPYRCSIYADRPRACADFPVGSEACLSARRRVGLSP
ncbi:MAG: hypothetical protein JWN48_1123 [Myxococcaceae bacterium]|nr:hypothetical protein [Myxococcaceae bacterium]